MKKEFKVIAELLPKNVSVLDVGCGDGSQINLLIKEKNIKARGLEIKEEYVKKVLKERYPNDVSKTSLNAEEMSEFYKDFLDQKWSSHIKYNLEWQKRNFTLIFLSILVGAEKIKHKIFKYSDSMF